MVILFDQYNWPDDVFDIVFATSQQKIVAKVLAKMMMEKGGEVDKTTMSFFATQLHESKLVTDIDDPAYAGKKVKLTYNKRQFYDRILTPMRSMGMIDYDLYKKKYRISTRFNQLMVRIGLMWVRHVQRGQPKQ